MLLSCISSNKDIVGESFIEDDADDQQKGYRNAMSDSNQKQTKIDTKFERPTETDSKEKHTHTHRDTQTKIQTQAFTHKSFYTHVRKGCAPTSKIAISPQFLTLVTIISCERVARKLAKSFFPTCQVRVVRFYQSALPPPHLPPPRPPPPRLAVLFLLVLLLASSFNFSSTMSASTSTCTSSPSSLPTSQLSVHRWTSTWDLPSSVCTAGPQPGTFPAQCAPLDLNLRPAQLSVHRWTSTAR